MSVPITASGAGRVSFRMVGNRTLEQISSACRPISGSPVYPGAYVLQTSGDGPFASAAVLVSSRTSQTFATFQSRNTVSGEM